MDKMSGLHELQLLGENNEANQAVNDVLNNVLSEALAAAGSGRFSTFQLTETLFPKIECLAGEHPEFGVLDTEWLELRPAFSKRNLPPHPMTLCDCDKKPF